MFDRGTTKEAGCTFLANEISTKWTAYMYEIYSV